MIQKTVAEAMGLLDKIADLPTKLGLIDTLRLITEGKVGRAIRGVFTQLKQFNSPRSL